MRPSGDTKAIAHCGRSGAAGRFLLPQSSGFSGGRPCNQSARNQLGKLLGRAVERLKPPLGLSHPPGAPEVPTQSA